MLSGREFVTLLFFPPSFLSRVLKEREGGGGGCRLSPGIKRKGRGLFSLNLYVFCPLFKTEHPFNNRLKPCTADTENNIQGRIVFL